MASFFRIVNRKLLGAAAILALLIGGLWLAGGSQLDLVVTSPESERYRIEYVRPSRFQQLRYRDMEIPSYVKLYDNWANRLLGESEIVDMAGNGEVLWSMERTGEISVGMDIRFRNIPPESSPCVGCSPK